MRSQNLAPRLVKLTTRTNIEVRRSLPHRDIRTIGAWCFIDAYGPTSDIAAMSVAAHPHAGLQTVTWLFAGEVEHRDSLGSVQVIHPGELNIMSAGSGIAHSELSSDVGADLHGVQLWTVLPENNRNMKPRFDHYARLPHFALAELHIRLFVGELAGRKAESLTFTPLVGAEITYSLGIHQSLELNPEFEYGVLVIEGEVTIAGQVVPQGNLLYLNPGNRELVIESSDSGRLLLLGGEPFNEEIIMWWNFIARSQEEIEELREKWNNHSPDFPDFPDHIGGRIPAPNLPNIRLTPRGGRR